MPPQNSPIPPIKPVSPQPRAPGEPVQSTPYDFIMSPNAQPPESKGFSLTGGPKLILVATIGGGVTLLLFLVLLLTQRSTTSPGLVSIAQQQAEIARVAQLGFEELHTSDVKNFVITTQLSVRTANTDFLNYLSSRGTSVDEKQIALGTNTSTDTAFENAKSSGALDTTVLSTLQAQLEQYQQSLNATYASSTNPETKTLLKTYYEQVELLLEQSKP